ncbi:hypothetical protein AVEN_176165-1 [Araneus ventricosus]|uniref:Uncharacterized protein n=1 Tax=Araneus ventricosus TaxID=182803 RepID=A0A4Y2RRE2_ARAVE|nr:hypothetical protein AVEN_176165-1 [Araneus ventricosus]
MPKRKREITGDAASRREAIRKRERRVVETEEERSRRLQLYHNVARTEERKKQKNKEIADCRTWHNVGRREEPKKQKNKGRRTYRQTHITLHHLHPCV